MDDNNQEFNRFAADDELAMGRASMPPPGRLNSNVFKEAAEANYRYSDHKDNQPQFENNEINDFNLSQPSNPDGLAIFNLDGDSLLNGMIQQN